MDKSGENKEEIINQKESKDEAVDLKIPKKGLIISAIVVVVLLLAVLVWQSGIYKKIYAFAMPATLEVTVTDKDTSKPISDALITVDNSTAKTDVDGKAKVTGLSAKKSKVTVTAIGYIGTDQTVKLKRKGNFLALTLILNIEKTTLTGKVTDFVNDAVLPGVEISVGDKKVTTDSEGKFTIADLPTGEQTFDLSKEGYNKKTEKDTVLKDKPLALTLTPTGKVYFISNREEGKRGIYSCNYDGSEVTRLVKAVAGTEDYNLVISPDRTKIAFLSTREKRKDSNNSDIPDLFLINSDGTKLTKIDSTFGINIILWSSDSKYLLWNSMPVEKEYTYYLNAYNIKSAKSEKLNSNGSSGNFIISYDGTMVVWNQSTINGNPTSEQGIFYRKLSGGDVNKVVDKNASDLSFSNDGKSIRYSYYDDAAKATKYINYLISDGSSSEYKPEDNKNSYKAMSPDKKKYAYVSNRDGKSDVYVSDLDGKNEKKLTALGTVTGLSWELNNQYILFDSSKTAETAKYIVDISGGDPKKVTDEYADNNREGGM